MNTLRRKKENGFVILFAVVVTSIVLLIALGIANVGYKEGLLSSSARDGASAFFTADSGLECAIYWDARRAFDTPEALAAILAQSSPLFVGRLMCSTDVLRNQVGADKELYVIQDQITLSTYYFSYQPTNANTCVRVTVEKDYHVNGDPVSYTRIGALGYNTLCSVPPGSTLRQVERAVGILYENVDTAGLGTP